MAHFLRGQFRENEGELIGALLLFRKAAEAYDPEAHDALANVYLKIYQHETLLNRPVAARGRAGTGRPLPARRPGHPRAVRRRVRRRRARCPTGPQEVHVPPHRQAGRAGPRHRQVSRRPQGVRGTHAAHPRRPGRVVQPRRRAGLARRAAEGRRGARTSRSTWKPTTTGRRKPGRSSRCSAAATGWRTTRTTSRTGS